jgi:tetratricopeptide (TPR) repeat protein
VEKAERALASQGVTTVQKTPERLVAESELHLRTGNYELAIDMLSRVVELRRQGKASESTDADAQFMLGKAYFATGQLYSAKSHFEVVTDRAEDPAFAGMGGPSASRLVDIALEIQRKDTLKDVLARVDRMLQRSSDVSLRYARAKALFAMDRYDDSLHETELIEGAAVYVQRGAYLRGTALMKKAQIAAKDPRRPDYGDAIEAFAAATQTSKTRGETAKSDEISDLAWLAIARLNYAVGRNGSAAEAYQKVERQSKHFSQALFELAWTFVRLGDYERGEKALEALSVLDPGLIDGADGELLRGDLLLRSGRFKDADEAYSSVRANYDPLRAQVSDFVERHTDSAVYYDKLTVAEIEIGQELPIIAIEWAREEAAEERIFAIVDDVARARSLVRRSRRIIALIRACLASKSRVRLFPELSAELQETLIQQNRLGAARLTLAQGLDSVKTNLGSRADALRSERQQLSERLGGLPTTAGNFSVRDSASQEIWNRVSQKLQRLQLLADHLKALVNGLRRVVVEAQTHGVVVNSVELARYRQELAENEKELALYFLRIDELRRQVELGRVQVGLGDVSFAEDDRVRQAFRSIFSEEAGLASSSSNEREASYARATAALLRKADAIDAKLSARRARLEQDVETQARETWKIVETEAEAIESHAAQLDTMDQHARLLVGEVAQKNFVKVRDRLANVVLRADVGLAQQAWEVREEQRERVRDLLRQRAREERIINEELQEVLDDGNGGGP